MAEAGNSAGKDYPILVKNPGKKQRSRDHYNDSSRDIDQTHLANLLRESAEVVERGEFHAILYEALQDFRAYYKQKYPKAGKKKKPIKHEIIRESSVGSYVSGPPEKSSEVPNDRKETEDNTAKSACSFDEVNAKQEQEDDNSHTVGSSSHSAEPSEKKYSKAGNNGDDGPDAQRPASRDTFVTSGGSSVPFDEAEVSAEEIETSDKPNAADAESIPVEAPVSATNVSMAPPSASANANPAKSSTTTAPTENSVPIESASFDADFSHMATPNPTRPPPIAVAVASATQQNHNRTAGFGMKFNLGATLKNVKKAAINVTENLTENITGKHHHHHKPGTDIPIFTESGITMAESSGRRSSVNEDTHERRKVGFQSRVTVGKAGARTAGHPASEQYFEYPAKQRNGLENYDGESQKKFSQDDGNAPLHSSVNIQTQQSSFESERFAQKQQQFDSVSGVPGSESAGHYDSEAEGTRGELPGSSGTTNPKMEIGVGSIRSKPSFQLPANKDSTLIANGWIEQFRRSKMRHVWKEVLASLVKGRNPGEVTTLWIQRETVNPTSGKTELEALHRIPLKLLQDISLTEYSSDNQFRLKIYNSTEDFVFRCSEAPNDALRWVQILKKHERLSKGTTMNGKNGYHEEKKAGSYESAMPIPVQQQQQQQPPSTKGMPIRDLRATCHGAGVNTAGMERAELEAAAAEIQRQGTYFDQGGVAAGRTQSPARYSDSPKLQQYATPQKQQQPPPQYAQSHSAQPDHNHVGNLNTGSVEQQSHPQQEQQQPEQKRLGIKDLRAICHGAGINTVGMERRELEAAANEVQSRGTYFPSTPAGVHAPVSVHTPAGVHAPVGVHTPAGVHAPTGVHTPAGVHAPSEEEVRARQEEYRRQQEELKRRQESEAALKRHQLEVEEGRRRAAELEVRRQEEARRRAIEEDQRRRAAEEEARRRAAAEESHRRAAAEEQARRQREAQAAQERYAQQQAAWQQQQQAEQQRRHLAEQQAAQERRRREEALRKEQEWAAQAQGAYPQQQWQQQQQQQQQQYQAYPPQQQWQQQQQQRPPPPQQHARSRTPPPQQQQQQQQQQRQNSGADNKYAKMANQSQDDGQAAITKIKHGILIQWALQPPQLQMLRPIAALVTTIHTVFPPALGVSGHDYFTKWKAISREDVAGTNGLPEDAKLKKAVRKIRFFLHPDKLPHDLNEEQKFTVKMLWDVTNDSWEEHQKHKDDLDWVS